MFLITDLSQELAALKLRDFAIMALNIAELIISHLMKSAGVTAMLKQNAEEILTLLERLAL